MPIQQIFVNDKDKLARPCVQVRGVQEEEYEDFVSLVRSIGDELKVKLFVVRVPSWVEVQFFRDTQVYNDEPKVMRDVLSLVCRRFG